jgi:hypothetical protein
VYAVCPPIVPCKVTAEASTIAGSNADQKLISFTQQITTSTNQVATALVDMANANASSLTESAQSLISSNAELSQIELNQTMTIERALADRDLAHKQQLAEDIYRSQNSVVSFDDTKEEFQLIIDALNNNKEKTVPEIILLLQETFDKDDENGYVLIPLASSAGVCSEEDVQEGKCSFPKRVYPSKKLTKLFHQCSLNKKSLIESAIKKETRATSIELANKKLNESLKNQSSENSLAQQQGKQKELSCSPSEYKRGLCGQDLTQEDYQEKIIIGDTIPNGDVSATNFNSPTTSFASGYIDNLDDATKQDIENASLDRSEINNEFNQKVIPLVHTYRNANQVKSALNFIDNVASESLIDSLKDSDKKRADYAEYQQRYLARMASLSAVRTTLNNSLSMRVGDKMRELINNGTMETTDKFNISLDSDENKESVLGAGSLDILTDKVNEITQLNAIKNGNDNTAVLSEGDLLNKINTTLSLQTEMLFDEYLMNEQIIMLDAIDLSLKVNSNQVAQKFKELKSGR